MSKTTSSECIKWAKQPAGPSFKTLDFAFNVDTEYVKHGEDTYVHIPLLLAVVG